MIDLRTLCRDVPGFPKKGIVFKAKDFCQEYKTDKNEIHPGKVREVIIKFLSDLDLENNLKVMTNKDLIKIQVIKKN